MSPPHWTRRRCRPPLASRVQGDDCHMRPALAFTTDAAVAGQQGRGGRRRPREGALSRHSLSGREPHSRAAATENRMVAFRSRSGEGSRSSGTVARDILGSRTTWETEPSSRLRLGCCNHFPHRPKRSPATQLNASHCLAQAPTSWRCCEPISSPLTAPRSKRVAGTIAMCPGVQGKLLQMAAKDCESDSARSQLLRSRLAAALVCTIAMRVSPSESKV